MNLDAIIESVNKKLKAFSTNPIKLEELDLTESERSFNQQYKPENNHHTVFRNCSLS